MLLLLSPWLYDRWKIAVKQKKCAPAAAACRVPTEWDAEQLRTLYILVRVGRYVFSEETGTIYS